MTRTNQSSQKFTDQVISRVPLRRRGHPQDFAGIALLPTSEASGHQTGTTVVVVDDDGYTIS